MFRQFTSAVAISLALAGSAWAETVEVKMLNKGEAGTMVFEPALVRLAPSNPRAAIRLGEWSKIATSAPAIRAFAVSRSAASATSRVSTCLPRFQAR